MKSEKPVFLDYEDGMLLDSPDLRRDLIAAMRRFAPDVVITHFPGDGSNDHGMTGQAVTKSLITLPWPNTSSDTLPMKKMPQLFYMDTAGGIGFAPDIYVDISEVIDGKKAAFLCHESQAECDPNYLETIEVLSRFRGFQAGFRYGEGFIGHQFFGSMADCRILP
jgi:LmbE family N-acetylglucosaminyl deacetylase